MSPAVASMLTYHNEQPRKDAMVASMQKHRELDRVQQGETGKDGSRGCAVSCAYQSVVGWEKSYNHLGLADHLGVPEFLPRLVDRVFEGLPSSEAGAFAEGWLSALPVGADTDGLKAKICARLFQDCRESLGRAREAYLKYAAARPQNVSERMLKARARMDVSTAALLDLAEVQITGSRAVTAAERRAARDEAYSARQDVWAAAAVAAVAAAVAAAAAEAVAAVAAVAVAAVAEAVAVAAVAEAEAEAVAVAAVAVAAVAIPWSRWCEIRASARHEYYRKLAAFIITSLAECPIRQSA